MAKLLDSDLPMIKSFRGKGFKATPQRIAISRFLLHNHDHPTAQKIHNEVKKMYPTVSLATVYKTIQILKEIGLVQELKLLQNQARFDPNMEPHAHLVCLRCGSISDWIDPLVTKIIDKVSSDVCFNSEGQNFDIYGVCRNCFASDERASRNKKRCCRIQVS